MAIDLYSRKIKKENIHQVFNLNNNDFLLNSLIEFFLNNKLKVYIKCSGFKGLLVCIISKQRIHACVKKTFYLSYKSFSLNKFHTTNDVLFFFIKIYSSNIKITFDDLMCTDICLCRKWGHLHWSLT